MVPTLGVTELNRLGETQPPDRKAYNTRECVVYASASHAMINIHLSVWNVVIRASNSWAGLRSMFV